MNPIALRTRIALPLTLMVFMVGCGGKSLPPLGQISGTVFYNGNPVEKAMIIFHNPKGRPARGSIIDGEIQDVITYDTLNDGVPLGKMPVTIHPFVDPEAITRQAVAGPARRNVRPSLPPRYADLKTTNLSVDIHEGQNEVELSLVN